MKVPSFGQQAALILLRFAVGWHLFFQGYGKLIDPAWSSRPYLTEAWGPFGKLAEDPTMIVISDQLVVWGLILTGLFLMIGLFTQFSCVAAILLLLLIYLARPPLDYSGFVTPSPEGAELYVNKALVELLSLFVVFTFRTGRFLGLDILLRHWRRK